MQVTLFGYIWILTNIIFMIKGYKYQFFLLLFSCILQSNSVIILSKPDFPYGSPVLIVALSIIIRHAIIDCSCKIAVNRACGLKREKFLKGLSGYFIYSFIASVILAGFIYKGLPIFTAAVVYTNVYRPLSLTVRLFYLGFLYLIYVGCAKILMYRANIIEEKDIIRLIEFISLFVVSIGVIQYIQKYFGIEPTFLLRNFIYSGNVSNGYIEGYIRFYSTFLEPSYTAVFFAGLFWFRISQGDKYNKIVTVAVLVGLLWSLGMTGYGAFVFGGTAFVVLNRNKKAALFVCILGFTGVAGLICSGYWKVIFRAIELKGQAVTRPAWNRLSLELIRQTHGMGVGIGVARAASLVLNVLVKTGIIGFVLYFISRIKEFIHYFQLRKRNTIYIGLFLYSFTVLAGQMIADPDLEFEVFWFGVFLYALTINNKNILGTEYGLEEKIKIQRRFVFGR